MSDKQRNKRRILIIVLAAVAGPIAVFVVACILTLKFFPDGLIAYYILDFVETVQGKLSGG